MKEKLTINSESVLATGLADDIFRYYVVISGNRHFFEMSDLDDETGPSAIIQTQGEPLVTEFSSASLPERLVLLPRGVNSPIHQDDLLGVEIALFADNTGVLYHDDVQTDVVWAIDESNTLSLSPMVTGQIEELMALDDLVELGVVDVEDALRYEAATHNSVVKVSIDESFTLTIVENNDVYFSINTSVVQDIRVLSNIPSNTSAITIDYGQQPWFEADTLSIFALTTSDIVGEFVGPIPVIENGETVAIEQGVLTFNSDGSGIVNDLNLNFDWTLNSTGQLLVFAQNGDQWTVSLQTELDGFKIARTEVQTQQGIRLHDIGYINRVQIPTNLASIIANKVLIPADIWDDIDSYTDSELNNNALDVLVTNDNLAAIDVTVSGSETSPIFEEQQLFLDLTDSGKIDFRAQVLSSNHAQTVVCDNLGYEACLTLSQRVLQIIEYDAQNQLLWVLESEFEVTDIDTDPNVYRTLQDQELTYYYINDHSLLQGLTPLNFNSAPVTSDDSVTLDEDSGVLVVDVLANDDDADSDDIQIASFNHGGVLGLFTISDDSKKLSFTPNLNQTGTETLEYVLVDAQGGYAAGLLNIQVNAINDSPDAVDDVSQTQEDVSVLIDVLANDSDIDGDALVVLSQGLSANSGDVVLTTNGVQYTPNANFFGTDTISYTVSDGNGATDSAVVSITVSSVNDAPQLTPIQLPAMSEDGIQTVSIPVSDADLATELLNVSAFSFNSDLITFADRDVSISQNSISLRLAPKPESFGSADIRVTVTDDLGSQDTLDLTLVVNEVNDAPVLSLSNTTATIDEDSVLTGLSLFMSDLDSDAFVVTAVSSNTSLLPQASILVTGSGGQRTISLVPSSDASGQAKVTFSVSDGENLRTIDFDLTVNAVNDTPEISQISNLIIAENGSTGPISFSVSDAETPVGSLSIDVSSDNPSVIPNVNLALSVTNQTVTVTPATNATGIAKLTLSVSDGQLTDSSVFFVSVNALEADALISGDVFKTIAANQSSTSGQLTAIDSVSVPVLFQVQTTFSGQFGSFSLQSGGQWVYELDQSNSQVLSLKAGEQLREDFEVSTVDGSFAVLTILVNGVNDSPNIAPIDNIVIAEDSSSDSIFVTITDSDSQLSEYSANGYN